MQAVHAGIIWAFIKSLRAPPSHMQTITVLLKYLKSSFMHYATHWIEADGRNLRKDFYAIDATEISLNIHDFPWVLFRSTIGGIKMHTKYDINGSVLALRFRF